MENSYVFAILFAFSWLSGGTDGMPCSKGEKLFTTREGEDYCIMCDQGTFMDEENHSLRTCKPCTKMENSEVEVHVSACNRTHDAEILCTSGFYRRRARNARQKDRCEECTECSFPARNCDGYYDTVCCRPHQYAVMSRSGVFVCKERPIVCSPGQFFNSDNEECTPCPDRTFMSARNHRYHSCLKCEELSGNNDNHAVIIRPCSRIAPTLFGCEEGYFRDPRQESTQTEVPCTRCRNWSLAECCVFQGCKGEEMQGEEMQRVEEQEANAKSDASNVEDLITQLKSLFPRIWDNCALQCSEEVFGAAITSIAQLDPRARKCMNDCLIEIYKTDEVSAWLQAALCILLSVLINSVVFCLPKNAFILKLRNRCLNRRQFACVLIIFIVCNSILFSLKACLETKIIENKNYSLIITTIVCYIFLIANLAIVVIFVTNISRRSSD